jgi:hypothetical protein
VTVVVLGEEMAIYRVADDPHVHPESSTNVFTDNGRLGGVEMLGRGPTGGVGNIRVSGVGCVAVLVDEVPFVLWGKEKDLRSGAVTGSDGGCVKVIEGGGLSFTKVCEGKVDEIVACLYSCTGKDMICALIEYNRRILQSGEIVRIDMRRNERATGAPREGGREF